MPRLLLHLLVLLLVLLRKLGVREVLWKTLSSSVSKVRTFEGTYIVVWGQTYSTRWGHTYSGRGLKKQERHCWVSMEPANFNTIFQKKKIILTTGYLSRARSETRLESTMKDTVPMRIKGARNLPPHLLLSAGSLARTRSETRLECSIKDTVHLYQRCP